MGETGNMIKNVFIQQTRTNCLQCAKYFDKYQNITVNKEESVTGLMKLTGMFKANLWIVRKLNYMVSKSSFKISFIKV